MLDVWKAFGIEYVSPSHLTNWNDDRGVWFAKIRKKLYDDAGAKAWRGDAVEAGLFASFKPNSDPLKVALDLFELKATQWSEAHDGEVHKDYDEAKAEILVSLPRAIEAWKAEGLEKPAGYQLKAETFLPGTRVKMYGKPDFALKSPKCCVDLKTSGQIPSQPKDENKKPEAKTEHAIAASFYALSRGEKTAKILYVSTADKPKTAYRMITLNEAEIAFYVRAATDTLRTIEATLLAAIAWSEYEIITKEEALAQLCRPNMLAKGGGTFNVWNPEYAGRALLAVPEWQ